MAFAVSAPVKPQLRRSETAVCNFRSGFRRRCPPVQRPSRVAVVVSRIKSTDEGFVSCNTCGADTPVALSSFTRSAEVPVTCCVCGRRWKANAKSVFSLDSSAKIVSAAARIEENIVEASNQNCKLYVAGLGPKTTTNALQTVFAEYGAVVDASIVCDKVTGRSRGFGFVTMANESAADAAASSLHDSSKLGGARLTVRPARER